MLVSTPSLFLRCFPNTRLFKTPVRDFGGDHKKYLSINAFIDHLIIQLIFCCIRTLVTQTQFWPGSHFLVAEYSFNRVPCIRILLKRFVSKETAIFERFVQQKVDVKIKTDFLFFIFFTFSELVTDIGADFTQPVS